MDVVDQNERRVRDIAPLLLDTAGTRCVVPASVMATTAEERLVFGMRQGLYSFPTVEFLAFPKDRIRGRSAIKIDAGHGQLPEQNRPAIRGLLDAAIVENQVAGTIERVAKQPSGAPPLIKAEAKARRTQTGGARR